MTDTPAPPPPASKVTETDTLLASVAPALVKPKPGNTLLASAQRITSKDSRMVATQRGGASWHNEVWDMYEHVGELRFLATTLAGRLAQARFYAARLDSDGIPNEIEAEDSNNPAQQVFDNFGDGRAALTQMVYRLGVNLFMTGDGWLAGIPRRLLGQEPSGEMQGISPFGDTGDLTLDDLDFRTLSVSEVTFRGDGTVVLYSGAGPDEQIEANVDDLFLIRVWRPHPRRWWDSDSPTRSALPVLRELVGLTMHVSAQVDSRLAGAGLLIVPQSARDAIARATGVDDTDGADPVVDALMEAMITPISDRESASAVVPLVLTVPDEAADKFEHISFSTNLDTEARSLRDEAIRRLALSLDAPPELLMGADNTSHWGQWLIREDVVTTHLEPVLALICDALTSQFLVPVLMQQGLSEEEARQYTVWYDVSELVMRPNKSQDAFSLHERGAISDTALRKAAGFTDEDAPAPADVAFEIAVAMAKDQPEITVTPGLPEVVRQLREIINSTEQADPREDPGLDIPDDDRNMRGPETRGDQPGLPTMVDSKNADKQDDSTATPKPKA